MCEICYGHGYWFPHSWEPDYAEPCPICSAEEAEQMAKERRWFEEE